MELNIQSSDLATSQASRVRALFDVVEPSLPLTLEVIARATKSSPRTIQRELASEGETFSQILDDWRAQRAFALLADPKMSMLTVAHRLHYAQLPNFIRAFERWTGTSPRRFMQGK